MENKEVFISSFYFAVPRHIKDEEWENYSVEQKDEFGEWLPFRFKVSQLESYRVAIVQKKYIVRIELKSGESYTTKLNLKEFDEKMKEAGYELI